MPNTEKDSFLYAFGQNLAEIRRGKKMSQEQLAFSAEIDLGTLSKLERGLLNISIYNTYKLARALNITNSELFKFQFPKTKNKK